MRVWMLLCCALLLTACATEPRLPPVLVEVPVSVPCIHQVPRAPAYETDHLQADASLCEITDALMIERQQRMIYIKQLKASIAGCTKEGM